MNPKSPWLVHSARRHPVRSRLVCFPCAGAGASLFREWSRALPDDIDLLAVQPPGRESRFTEPNATDLRGMAASIAQALVPWLNMPYATFGHSLGTLLSYETVLELRRRSLPLPFHMIQAGRMAPHLRGARNDYHLLPTDRFIEELRKMEGTPAAVLESEELMELLLPMLRADFALNSEYVVGNEPPLDIRMTAYGGTGDVEAQEQQLSEWRGYTSGPFAIRMFEGGHFFINSARSQVLHCVAGDLNVKSPVAPVLDGAR